MRRTFAAALLAVFVAAIIAPAVAGASSPTSDQYGKVPVVQNVSGSGGGGGGASSAPTPSGLNGQVGPLPFTGFDVVSMAAVALGVTGLGLLLQRAVSRRPNEEV